MKKPNQSQLEVIDRALVLTRQIDAPLRLVYQVWTQPEHFAKWWGPHTFTNPICELDPREGGKFLVTMHSPDGEENSLKGEFVEVIPHQKLVLKMYMGGHSKAWHEMVNAARGLAPDAIPADVLTTVLFEDVQGKTKLTIEQRFENNNDRDAFVKLGTADGWGQSFVKMDSLVATLATEREFKIMRTVSAPRSLVWKVWSDPAHLAKWWGPNGFTNTIFSHDLRPGGEWLYTMHGPDGTDYPNWMRFEEVVPESRITYVHGSVPNDPEAFHGEVTFEDVEGGKTFVTLHLRMASAEVRAGAFAYGAFEGGDQTLSRLDAFVQAL